MVRLIARTAVAAGLAAAVALPLTQVAGADTLPSVPAPSVPALPAPLNQLVPVPLAPATNSTSTSSSTSASDPSSSASSIGLSLPGLNTCVSCTDGTSSTPPPSSTSNSTALKVLGYKVAGGSASGDQTNNGALIALPANPLVSLAIADWIAKATSNPTTFERAALLDLNLNPDGSNNTNSALYQVATLAILESDSSTTADCASGGGASAHSNGARLGLGNSGQNPPALGVILLHSGASTSDASQNKVYLASINGNEIGTSSQTGGPINITVPNLLTVSLLVTPGPSCGTTPPGCTGDNCNNGSSTVCPPGVLSVQLPPGTCLGSGVNGNASGTTGAAPASNVQGATTGGGTGVPETGIALGILGFLLLGGGLFAMAASRFARRWRSLT